MYAGGKEEASGERRTAGSPDGFTPATNVAGSFRRRNGVPWSRPSIGVHMPGDRDDGSARARPRTCPPSGTGDSFQMTASSPNTAWAARTGSANRSDRARSPSTPGSGRTSVTFDPSGAFTVAVGSGFNVGP